MPKAFKWWSFAFAEPGHTGYTHSLTDSEVAIYFEMGVGFADLSIYIFVYVLKEYF